MRYTLEEQSVCHQGTEAARLPVTITQGHGQYLFMAGIDQLPCLLNFLFESYNGSLVLLTEAQSCLHLGSIPHNLAIQLLHLLCQPLLIVYRGKAGKAVNSCRTNLKQSFAVLCVHDDSQAAI